MSQYCQLAFHDDFVDSIATVKWTDEDDCFHDIRVCKECYERLINRLVKRDISFKVVPRNKPKVWSVS